MIAEAGLAALWLATALALLQLFLAFGPRTLRSIAAWPVRAIAVVEGFLTVFAMAMLMWVFERTDLSVLLVAENSHSAKPWVYKVAGAWGNHEGSMLLWVTILGLAGAALAIFSRRLEEKTLTAALGAQAALALGFFAFLLLSSNPFTRLNPPAFEGRGLNPLLQDPGLVFHPPTLYLGYVGLSVAFSLAVGALITGKVDSALAKAMRPWVLGAWILLTLGITAGSYWAYYELGWGGWWFWDPVENASLMPWLAATALLHSLNVLAARDSLRAWTIMLAMVAFSMSMVGTFLVRSGVLTSVHAFAVDPQRGTFLLALLALYVGAAFALFATRSGKLSEGPRFELVSREAALVGNNLLLTVILGIVFIGTLYPLFIEALTGAKLSVGAPYFNSVAGPLALILAILVCIGPLLNWRRDSGESAQAASDPGADRSHCRGDCDPCAARRSLPGHRRHRNCRHARGLGLRPAGRPKAEADSAHDLGNGRRAFRSGGGNRWNCDQQYDDNRGADRRPSRRPGSGRAMAGRVALDHAGCRIELDGSRGRASRFPGQRRDRAQAAIAILHQPSDRDDGVGDKNRSFRSVVHRAWQAGRRWPLATSSVVETAGDSDLAGRLAHRLRRCDGARRPRVARLAERAGAVRAKWIRLLPAALVTLIVAALVWRLANPPDTNVELAMVGQHVPQFAAASALPGRPGVSSADLANGKPKLVNFFASWCVPCVGEAPVLEQLKQRGATIEGIAIRDRTDELRQFLSANGDPFDGIGSDPQSQVQLAFGSAGVPETFVIDGHGIIRMQHIGPIEPGDVPTILQALKDAK